MFTVLVMTSDTYTAALKPFMHLFRKYWRGAFPDMGDDTVQEVVVAGFTPPTFLPELGRGVKFDSLGEFKDYPINRWSDSLIEALTHIQNDYVVIMLEDYWLTHTVNLTSVHHAFEYMWNNPNVIKFDLAGDRRYAQDADLKYATYKTLEIIRSKEHSPYHLSLMTGMWKKQHLLEVLVPGWSPWDVEIAGTRSLSARTDLVVVGSHQWPVQHTLAFRGGDIDSLLLGELKIQDQNEMRTLGFFDPWEKPGE